MNKTTCRHIMDSVHLEERKNGCNLFTADESRIDGSKICRDRLCFNFALAIQPAIRVLGDACAVPKRNFHLT
jgi:hypothetical protein